MTIDFQRSDVMMSFKKFADYGADLALSEYSTFENCLDIFLNHCKKDPIMQHVIGQIHNPGLYEKYKDKLIYSQGSMRGSSKLFLPVEAFERDSFIYEYLLMLQSKTVSVTSIPMLCSHTHGVNNQIAWFMQNIFKKFTRSLDDQFSYILAKIDPEGDIVPSKILILYQDNSINVGDNPVFKGDAALGMEAYIEKSTK